MRGLRSLLPEAGDKVKILVSIRKAMELQERVHLIVFPLGWDLAESQFPT